MEGPQGSERDRRSCALLPRIRDRRREAFRRRRNGAAVLRGVVRARLGVDVPQEDTLEAWTAHGDTMAARFREKTRAEWESELVTAQSCASPVLGLAEAPNHPHSRARATFVTVDGVMQPAPAPRFSRTALPTPSPPSMPGDDTLAILAEFGLEGADFVDTGVARQSTARSKTRREHVTIQLTTRANCRQTHASNSDLAEGAHHDRRSHRRLARRARIRLRGAARRSGDARVGERVDLGRAAPRSVCRVSRSRRSRTSGTRTTSR